MAFLDSGNYCLGNTFLKTGLFIAEKFLFVTVIIVVQYSCISLCKANKRSIYLSIYLSMAQWAKEIKIVYLFPNQIVMVKLAK